MAIQTAGYLGGFSGRLGPAVGYMWNGKWCMRSYRRHVANPRTAAQVAQRDMFKQEVQLAATMRWAVLTSMRDLARELGMTAFNLFVHANQHAFSRVDGAFKVDYPNLRLSIGEVAAVESPRMVREEGNMLNVSFGKGPGDGYDRVSLYVYAPELRTGFLAAPVYRRTKHISLALPDIYEGQELHAYLMVQGADGSWSESVYVPENDAEEITMESDGEATAATAQKPASTRSASSAKSSISRSAPAAARSSGDWLP